MPTGNSCPQSCSSGPAAISTARQNLFSLSQRYRRDYGLRRYGYIVGKSLGSGSYAKVKTAHCLKTNENVAIKIISKKSAPEDFFAKFLSREIEVIRTVKHRNIVRLQEVIETDKYTFLVMEMAKNSDLLNFINSRRFLTEHMARRLFTDLVSGMEKCHKMNVVHRDLKCENLLLDSELRLKIADFGFARTHSGQYLETYCGSYAYAAPEIILEDAYRGELADIWSMGVILYAMVVGRLPFKDTDVRKMLSQITSRLEFPSRVSEECKDLIRKILKFEPADRLSLERIKTLPWMQVKATKPPVPLLTLPKQQTV